MKKYHAFTIAEILIIIGIIGVIATITLPTFIINYQKQEYVNKLKKQYSLWSNVFKVMLTEEEVYSLDDTTVFQAIPEQECSYNSGLNCDNFYSKLSKYIKLYPKLLEKDYNSSWLDGTGVSLGYRKNQQVLLLPDGSMLVGFSFKRKATSKFSCEYVERSGGKLCYIQGDLKIDVNGLKPPNRNGRDIFLFSLSNDGVLYPWGGKDLAIQSSIPFNDTYVWCDKTIRSQAEGIGCAQRIIAEGWQMNY